jgi:hypothetical protein
VGGLAALPRFTSSTPNDERDLVVLARGVPLFVRTKRRPRDRHRNKLKEEGRHLAAQDNGANHDGHHLRVLASVAKKTGTP